MTRATRRIQGIYVEMIVGAEELRAQISTLKTAFSLELLRNRLSQTGMQPFVFSEETIFTSTKYPQTKALLTDMVTSISTGFHCTQAADMDKDDFYGSDGCYTQSQLKMSTVVPWYPQIHRFDSTGDNSADWDTSNDKAAEAC